MVQLRDLQRALSIFLVLLANRNGQNMFFLRARLQLVLAYLIRRRRRYQYAVTGFLMNKRVLRKIRQFWAIQRPQFLFEERLANRMLDCTWKQHFRVNRATFFYLVRMLAPRISKHNTQLRDAIPAEKRVAISLWRLGTGEVYRSISRNFGVGCKTANIILLEFLLALCEHYNEFVHFPDSDYEIRRSIDRFSEISAMPQVLAAIDGTYIPIRAPEDDNDDFICRKGYHSMILQAIVGADTEIYDALTRFPGSMHDARVLRLSSFFHKATNGRVAALTAGPLQNINGVDVAPYIVGDGAYPLSEWLLKPYPRIGVLAQDEKRFNKEISKARVKVEHCYGILKGLWRILRQAIQDDIQKVPLIILCCCILHNVCVFQNDEYDGSDFEEDSDYDDNYYGGNQSGQQLRDTIKDYL